MVSRPRLIAQFEKGRMNCKFSLISAPAGSGKTTIVAQWLREYSYDAVWISLEPLDDDFDRFWRMFITALDKRLHEASDRLIGYLNDLAPAQYHLFILSLLHELHDLKDNFIIVLDDLQVIKNANILNALGYFLERLPSQLHVIAILRNEPILGQMKSLVKGELNKVDTYDLTFTEEEGEQLLRTMNPSLSPSQIRNVLERTEGWAVGIKLTAMSLQGEPDDVHLNNLIRGYQRTVSDFLYEELFRGLSEEVRSFLLDTAVVSQMNAALCDALTGNSDGLYMLEKLHKQNLFIISLDAENEWHRYHHLFSEFLRKQLAKQNPDRLVELHYKSAKWMEERGLYSEAVEHYLKGEHYGEALRLLEVMSPVMFGNQWQTLYKWYSALPKSVLRGNVEIYFAYVLLCLLTEDHETVELELTLAEAFIHEHDSQWSEEMTSQYWGDFYFIKAYYALRILSDLSQVVTYTRMHFQYNRKKSLIWSINTNPGEASILRSFKGVWGKPKIGESFFLEMKGLMESALTSVLSGVFQVGYSECLYEWNRLEEARAEAISAFQFGKRMNRGEVIVPSLMILSKIEMAMNQVESAVQWLSIGKPMLGKMHPKWVRLLELQMFHQTLQSLGKAEIEDWLKQNDLYQSKMEVIEYQLFEWSVMMSALIQLEKYDEALMRLDVLVRFTEEHDRIGELTEFLLLSAIASYRLGQVDRSFTYLTRAIKIGIEQSFIRSFLDHRGGLKQVLSHYLDLRRNNHIRGTDGVSLPYIKKLASLFQINENTSKEQSDSNRVSPDLFTPTELQVLELLAQGITNQEIAERLCVSRGTVKTHLNHIYSKIHVSDRWQAIQIAKTMFL